MERKHGLERHTGYILLRFIYSTWPLPIK